jgi:hypothetical protein
MDGPYFRALLDSVELDEPTKKRILRERDASHPKVTDVMTVMIVLLVMTAVVAVLLMLYMVNDRLLS